jgi:hypothetical protein
MGVNGCFIGLPAFGHRAGRCVASGSPLVYDFESCRLLPKPVGKKKTTLERLVCAVRWWGRDQPINLVSEKVSAAGNVYVKTHTTVAPAVRMAFEVE